MRKADFRVSTPHGDCRIAYTQWGDPKAARTLVCLHGLTRNGRDFDALANALAGRYQVICPDMPGRGQSESLRHDEDYQYPVYLQICSALLEHLNVSSVSWLGTSMGGLIGMMLAKQSHTLIRCLVLNDVGAFVPATALRRIGEYLGNTGPLKDLEAVEARLRVIHAPFGRLTESQWRHLAMHSHWTDDSGRFWLAYDPKIATSFLKHTNEDVDLWAIWSDVRCPVLLLRGADSDILQPEVAEKMAARENCSLITLPAAGHAPPLMSRAETELITEWLELQ